MANQIPVTTVILAGGQGSRMGGDKALRDLRGLPLIEWVIGCIQPQDTQILISANTNLAELARFGYPVLPDLLSGYRGPLAGLHSAMHYAESEWVASVPCDTPFLPDDLIVRLLRAAGNAEAAVAVVEGRWQPTIAIYRRHLHARLHEFLESGERRVSAWLGQLQVREAVFEEDDAFVNINSLEELDAANGSTKN